MKQPPTLRSVVTNGRHESVNSAPLHPTPQHPHGEPIRQSHSLGTSKDVDLVGGHVFLGDPGVNGVFGDAKMGGDVASADSHWLGHVSPPSRPTQADIPDDIGSDNGLSRVFPGV